MKRIKTIIFLSLLLLFAGLAEAQESEKYLKLKRNFNYREGYILDKDSLKIEGLIKDNALNEAKIFTVVNFVYKDGRKKKYYSGDLKGFGFSIHKFISDGQSFYEEIQRGSKVSLYKNISMNSWSAPGAPGMGATTYNTLSETFYVKKAGEPSFLLVRKKNFIEEFSKYFEGCNEVVLKISNKQWTHKDIKEIVTAFNYCK